VGADGGFLTPTLFGFLLVLFRCTALCSVAPLFGMRSVPRRARMGIAFVLAFAAFSGAGFPAFRPIGQSATGGLVGAAIMETVIGLVAGISAQFAIDAATAAGQMASVAMGLSYGSVIDPLHGTDSPAIAELLSMFSVAALVFAGMHREAIAWLCRSVIEIPPGSTVNVSAMAGAVVTQAIAAVALAIRMAYPILVAVTFGHVALGVVSRTVPQLNVGSIGFSITILAGGGALYLVAPSIAELAARTATAVFTGGGT
jgi:flagellar biosynthesis protein FliR